MQRGNKINFIAYSLRNAALFDTGIPHLMEGCLTCGKLNIEIPYYG